MKNNIKIIVFGLVLWAFSSCKTPAIVGKTENRNIPKSYLNMTTDSTKSLSVWKDYFKDEHLVALIDTALVNNQELSIMKQEIAISNNEVMARKGEYMPFVSLRAGMGLDKPARYTQQGAVSANVEMKPGREMPDPLPDFMVGAFATWEADIWHKLRNATKAANLRYLASTEGRNFAVTNMVSEIASSYYELLALDAELNIINQNVIIQNNALRIVRLEKESAKVTELAVKRFEALVLNTQTLKFSTKQRIVETENKINFLMGRYPQPIVRDTLDFGALKPNIANLGLTTQLIENRPDIRQAELELTASKIDVQVAKANFYPRLGLSAGLGLQAFNPILLINPKSLLSNLAGDLIKPWINKRAITAQYFSANSRQIQSVYNYERKVLNAYIEVVNQYSNINNLQGAYETKSNEVQVLNQSITISNNLFRSARADYVEILLTQREALDSKFDLLEFKLKQLQASVNLYRALGGGWK